MITITSRDMLDQVRLILDASEHSKHFNADGITSEIVATFGLVDVDAITNATFWGIVARHDTGTW